MTRASNDNEMNRINNERNGRRWWARCNKWPWWRKCLRFLVINLVRIIIQLQINQILKIIRLTCFCMETSLWIHFGTNTSRLSLKNSPRNALLQLRLTSGTRYVPRPYLLLTFQSQPTKRVRNKCTLKIESHRSSRNWPHKRRAMLRIIR